MIRGGNFRNKAAKVRSAVRVHAQPADRRIGWGFRVALGLPAGETPTHSPSGDTRSLHAGAIESSGRKLAENLPAPRTVNDTTRVITSSFTGMPLIRIEAGIFQIGSTKGAPEGPPTSSASTVRSSWADTK